MWFGEFTEHYTIIDIICEEALTTFCYQINIFSVFYSVSSSFVKHMRHLTLVRLGDDLMFFGLFILYFYLIDMHIFLWTHSFLHQAMGDEILILNFVSVAIFVGVWPTLSEEGKVITWETSRFMYLWLSLYYGLLQVPDTFIHILQGYFTGTGSHTMEPTSVK